VSVKLATQHGFPSKDDLLDFFRDVRALTRHRLDEATEADFDRQIVDEHFGAMTDAGRVAAQRAG
jgi:hypothetical protein